MGTEFKPVGMRWVVLAVFSGVNLAIQMLWITYAPITHQAATFYGVSELAIGALAMSFMAAYLPFSVPASWVIDHRGFKFGVGVGAVLMAIFGPLRGLVGGNYPLTMLCTAMLAIAQPFFLNAWTKCAALWFPPTERATAVGVITLANLIGTGIGMAVTPLLLETMPIDRIQLIYGVVAAVTSVLFLVLAKDSPPGHVDAPPALMVDGLKAILKIPSFVIYLGVIFVGMGVFNGVTTWIEGIIRPRGFNEEQAGTLGAIMLVGGLFGAIAIPALSDRQGRRRFYLVLGMVLGAPGLLVMAWAQSFVVLAIASAWMGFWLTSTLPVGMQYAAELTRPTPEGTSSGLIQLVGQGSVVFVFAMEATKTSDGSFAPSLIAGVVLLFLAAAAATRLVEPQR
jgi:MFS family permease